MNKLVLFMLFFFLNDAFSRPVTAPGLFIGLPLGKPFPKGWYLIDMPGYIDVPIKNKPSTNVLFDALQVAYVGPQKIAGGQLEIYGGLPVAYYKSADQQHWLGNLYNPDLMFGIAWDLGHQFYFSNFVGTYFPMNTQGLSTSQFVFNDRVALTYSNDKNDITAHIIYGLPGQNYSSFKESLGQYINLDITATHRFDELQIGPIAFGSWDIATNAPWSQFAVGGIVGYDFGPLAAQGWLAVDTNYNHWGGRALTLYFRVIIPLDKSQRLDTTLDI